MPQLLCRHCHKLWKRKRFLRGAQTQRHHLPQTQFGGAITICPSTSCRGAITSWPSTSCRGTAVFSSQESLPQHPLSSGYLLTQAWKLDIQMQQLLCQRHDIMEMAFYAMKQNVQHVERDNKVLCQRILFLEAEFPHQVGQLQWICSCRSHLLVLSAGRRAVYSMDSWDLALLDVCTWVIL